MAVASMMPRMVNRRFRPGRARGPNSKEFRAAAAAHGLFYDDLFAYERQTDSSREGGAPVQPVDQARYVRGIVISYDLSYSQLDLTFLLLFLPPSEAVRAVRPHFSIPVHRCQVFLMCSTRM